MERKKTGLLILGVCALVLSIIGVTYAFWTLNLQQTDDNNLATSCFDVELINEENVIKLEKAYPILDEEGEKLTPYTFTLRNNCNANVKYQINLESLNQVDGVSIENDRLDSKYIKEKLNETNKEGSIRLLTENEKVEKTLDEAEESYKLITGYMTDKQEKTFELRLWLNGDLTMEDEEAMNKTFASKITIVATYAKEAKKSLVDTILALKPEAEDSGASGIYEVDHTGAEIAYTNNPFYQKRLQQTEYRYAGKNPNNYVDVGDKYITDAYGFFYQEKYYFATEETCKANRNESLNYLAGANLTECDLTPNIERLYVLEYKVPKVNDYSYAETFENSEDCQNTQEGYEFDGYNIVQECINPSNIYSYAYTYQYDFTEYSSNEDCISNNEYEIENESGICKITHSAGEPIYWRIIGLVNTSEGQRVKLIRDENIGGFSWDTSSEDVNDGWGVNEWSQSDLMKLLNPGYETNKDQICAEEQCTDDNLVNNSLYWNGKSGKCYTNHYNTATDCDFTNKKMPDNLKNKIDTVRWNTGAGEETAEAEGIVSKFYEYERSNNTGDICKSSNSGDYCNDQINRTTSWKGKVGLIYPSDLGYATSGGSETTRTMCLGKSKDNIVMYNWENYTDCHNNDWLLLLNEADWSLSPVVDSGSMNSVFYIGGDCMGVDESNSIYAGNIRPSVYLKPDVFVKQGDGSYENPYELD